MNTKHLLTRQIGIQNPFRRGNFGLVLTFVVRLDVQQPKRLRHNRIRAGVRPQEGAALPGRPPVGAEQVRDQLDLAGKRSTITKPSMNRP